MMMMIMSVAMDGGRGLKWTTTLFISPMGGNFLIPDQCSMDVVQYRNNIIQ